MRILYLADFIPPRHVGGPGKRNFEVATRLAELGHEVFFITSCQTQSQASQVDRQGPEERSGVKIFNVYSKYPAQIRDYFSIYNPFVVKKVKKIIKEIKPDVVHADTVHSHLSYACLKIAKKYSKAVFLHSRDFMMFHYGKFFPKEKECGEINYKVSWLDNLKKGKKRFNPFRNFLIKRYLRYVDKIFVVSRELEKALNANGINKTIVLHNSLPIPNLEPEFSSSESKNIFLYGRINEAKGVYALLDIFPKIKKNIPEAKIILAGADKDEQEKIKKYILKKNINLEDVRVFGWIDKEKIEEIYKKVFVVVNPSLCFDSFPGANLEAALHKKPVITTCFGGGKEFILDGKTGFVVNPFKKEELANKIIKVLSDERLAGQFVEAGYKRLTTEFSLDKYIEKLLGWYNKCL